MHLCILHWSESFGHLFYPHSGPPFWMEEQKLLGVAPIRSQVNRHHMGSTILAPSPTRRAGIDLCLLPLGPRGARQRFSSTSPCMESQA